MNFEGIEKQSFDKKVYQYIKKAIISNDLKPGEQLREEILSRQLNVSRGPIRDALIILEKEGLVNKVPYKGTFVSEFRNEDIVELCDLRFMIESFAITKGIEYLSRNQIGQLKAIARKMSQAAKQSQMDEILKYDLEFHKTLCTLPDYKRLTGIWSSLYNQICVMIAIANINYDDIFEIINEHNIIIESIKTKNVDNTVRCIKEHIDKMKYLMGKALN